MAKIIIDAGHGSNTSGKRTPPMEGYDGGYREHWINSMVAYYLDIALRRCGFQTAKLAWKDKYGRNDADISIVTRQDTVRAGKYDVVISCHANASNSNNKFDQAAGAVTYIDNVDANIKDSLALAKRVQKYLVQGTVQKDRGIGRKRLGICNARYENVRAAILVEVGFMTNEVEAKLMTTDKFCQEQAEDICKGVCEYFGVTYKTAGVVNGTIATTPSPVAKTDTMPKVGEVWKLTYEMKVRASAGTGGRVLKHAELTLNGQKCDSDKDGCMDSGTKVTVKDTAVADDYFWIKCPSGWIAAYKISTKKWYMIKA